MPFPAVSAQGNINGALRTIVTTCLKRQKIFLFDMKYNCMLKMHANKALLLLLLLDRRYFSGLGNAYKMDITPIYRSRGTCSMYLASCIRQSPSEKETARAEKETPLNNLLDCCAV